MGWLSRKLEEKRLQLLAAARRGAFDSYMRHGRVPEAYARIAAVASEAKALNTDVSLDTLGPSRRPAGRPTTHYVWRTAGDSRVRGSHASRNGQIFAWANPPEHGHPGQEPNCRCWPEPYYGDPAVPDTLLKMVPERRVNTDPGLLWASIETLTRPDGSLASSGVVMNDGTTIRSTFVGLTTDHLVTLPTQDTVRVQTVDGIQSIYARGSDTPLFQSKWTAEGPRVMRARQRFAFLLNDLMEPDSIIEPFDLDATPDPLDPDVMQPFVLESPGMGLGIVPLGILAIDEMRRATPDAMGVGPTDVPVIAYRIWTKGEQIGPDGKPIAVPVFADALTAEQAQQACPLLPQVQEWTDQAALTVSSEQPGLNAQNRGIAIHEVVKNQVISKKRDFPFTYRGVSAEYSIGSDGKPGRYAATGTKRLDVIDRIPPEDPKVVCDFEIKNGGAGMGGKQLNDYITFLTMMYPDAVIYVFQVGPTHRGPK